MNKKAINDAEYIMNEQSEIINEYHKHLKQLIDENQKLQKEAGYFKKEYNHIRGFSSSELSNLPRYSDVNRSSDHGSGYKGAKKQAHL